MQLVWVYTITGEEQRWTLYGQSAFLRLTQNGELRASAAPTPLRVEIEGQNVFVLDTGDGPPITIAGITVEKGQRRAWGRDQELRIGENVMFWVAEPAALRARMPAHPETLRRSAVVLATLAVLALLFGFLWFRVMSAENVVKAVMAPTPTTGVPTPIDTPKPAAIPNPPGTPPPTNTPTSTPTTVPETEVSPLHRPPSPTPDPPPVPTASLAQPEVWDERLNALGVNFVPAIVPVGGEFWRLFEAKWQDEFESAGRHHIFVDVVDAQQKRFQDREVRIRVSTDGSIVACTPTVDPSIQRPFGAECPMFNAGFAYTVSVDGLPSDRVERLGLGTIEDRFAPIHTSFILRFRLERRPNN